MAAKLLHSLTDENPDLQKQIGCMTGIFQLFDRHHIPAGRRIVGRSHKRPPTGSSYYNNDASEKEAYNICNRPAGSVKLGKHSNKHLLEKQRVSSESSRASFSSSSLSSSFSSPDCNKFTQPEPSSYEQSIFHETPSRDPTMIQSSASPKFGSHTVDLRDVVKDCMFREARGLSVKTTTKEESANCMSKLRDSLRPMQLSQTSDKSNSMGLDGKQNLPADLKESFRVLAKIQEAPWYSNKPRELSRSSSSAAKDESLPSIPKVAPQFFYEGRELNCLSFESWEASKSAQNLKELPRMSLDSREGSVRSVNFDPKSNLLSKNSQKESNSSDDDTTLQQTPESQSRPSVVAKLMGLEGLLDSVPANKNNMGVKNTYQIEDCEPFVKSIKTENQERPLQIYNASSNLWKEPMSPRWRNPDSVVKPVSRLPIEPAPWRQLDGNRASQRPTARSLKVPVKVPDTFHSVYGEIEKRLRDLEFTKSGKDLRALKQILEAMEGKRFLEERKGHDSNFTTQKDHEQKYVNNLQTAGVVHERKPHNDHAINSQKAFESPIVIMKPVKLVVKSGISASSVIPDNRKDFVNSRTTRDQIPKSVHRDNAGPSIDIKNEIRSSRVTQTSTRKQQLPKKNTTAMAKNSGFISPRMQQKKLELEKRSRPPTPPSEPGKSRRQSNKQQAESNSPGGRHRKFFSSTRKNDDQLRDSKETRTLSHHGSYITLQANDNTVSNPNMDTGSDKLTKTNGSQKQSLKKSSPAASEDGSRAELAIIGLEYPSPVSVLDTVAYIDDAPLPVKQMHKTLGLGDDRTTNSDVTTSKEQLNLVDNLIDGTTGSSISSEINRKKLQNIENLVQKLRRLNSSHDESRTDYIASLCENANPDHRYISEILLASGLLLRDLGSSLTTFQLHSSGYPINPELFLVLEQTKASTLPKEEFSYENVMQCTPEKEKSHRKLIFDIVNEVLLGKFTLPGSPSEPCLRPHKLVGKPLNAQKLLRELCIEIEQRQVRNTEFCIVDEDDGIKSFLWEDVIYGSESWTKFHDDISVVVLDVERLIFKDLVDDIVIDKAAGFRANAGRRCRQLFAK